MKIEILTVLMRSMIMEIYDEIYHRTCNKWDVLNIIQFEVMATHFINPPQHFRENTRNIFPKNNLQPFPRNCGVQYNQISFESCIYSFLAIFREDLEMYRSSIRNMEKLQRNLTYQKQETTHREDQAKQGHSIDQIR